MTTISTSTGSIYYLLFYYCCVQVVSQLMPPTIEGQGSSMNAGYRNGTSCICSIGLTKCGNPSIGDLKIRKNDSKVEANQQIFYLCEPTQYQCSYFDQNINAYNGQYIYKLEDEPGLEIILKFTRLNNLWSYQGNQLGPNVIWTIMESIPRPVESILKILVEDGLGGALTILEDHINTIDWTIFAENTLFGPPNCSQPEMTTTTEMEESTMATTEKEDNAMTSIVTEVWTTTMATTSGPFICSSSGRFPDPWDCAVYHICVENGETWSDNIDVCEDGTIYCDEHKQCYWPSLCPCTL